MKKLLLLVVLALGAAGLLANPAIAAPPGAPVHIKYVTKSGVIHVKQHAAAKPIARAASYAFCGIAPAYPQPGDVTCFTVYTGADASNSYLHTGNAASWFAYSANWGCAGCTTEGLARASLVPAGQFANMWPAPTTATYRVSNINVNPWVYWIRPDNRTVCWFGTNVVGNDFTMSVGTSSILWGCGGY